MLFLLYGGCIVKWAVQQEESPLLLVGSGPAQVFCPHFIKEDLGLQSSVSNVVRTTSVLGEISHPLPDYGEIAIMEGN